MNGIYFRDFNLVFDRIFVALGICSIVLIVSKFILRCRIEKRKKQKIQLYNIIQILFCSIWVSVPIFYLIIYRIEIFVDLIVLVCLALSILAFLLSFVEFIVYIFIKPLDFKATNHNENAFVIVGYIAFALTKFLSKENSYDYILQIIPYRNIFLFDTIKIISLLFWYFSLFFFPLVFLMLILIKMIEICESIYCALARNKENKKKNRSYSEFVLLSNLVYFRIKNIPKEHIDKIIIYWSYWVGCCMVDGIRVIVYFVLTIVKGLLSIAKTTIKKICLYLKNNMGKVIVICSRLAIIFSLLLTYIIDKYECILSNSGSDVYEFVCSVLLIPFLITSINLLKANK